MGAWCKTIRPSSGQRTIARWPNPPAKSRSAGRSPCRTTATACVTGTFGFAKSSARSSRKLGGLQRNTRGLGPRIVKDDWREDHAGHAHELLACDEGEQCQPYWEVNARADYLAVE